MTVMNITANRKKTGKSTSVEFDMPENLDGLVQKFGQDTIFSHAKGSLIVALQGFVRGKLDSEKSDADIRKAVADWKPGQRKPGKAPQEKLKDLFAKMSPEDRRALLADMQANAGAPQQTATPQPKGPRQPKAAA